jgi:hypothetical protein
MRRVLVALALFGAVIATGAPADSVKWADWVGDYQGKLRWTGCTAPGPESATVAIDATDAVMRVDLAPVSSGLQAMTLVTDEHEVGWQAQQGDVTTRLGRPAEGVIELAVDLDSGCSVRGSLKRASSGIAACDRLVAWSRIEGKCTKLTGPRLELPARLVRQRETWAKARGEERSVLAAQCDTRSAKVETELVDAGCAPNPDVGLVDSADCRRLASIAAKLERCGGVPATVKSEISVMTMQLLGGSQTVDASSRPVVDAQCQAAATRVADMAPKFRCML